MGFQEYFFKAFLGAQSGEIGRKEQLAMMKKIILENYPEPLTDEEAEKLARAAVDPSKIEIAVSSPDSPPYGEVPEIKPQNNGNPYKDKFFKAVNAAQIGKIDSDELLSAVKKIALEINPGITERDAKELAKISIGSANKISMPDLINETDLPDGSYELPNGGSLQIGPLKEEKVEISPETQAKLDKLLARVDELIPPVEMVRLKPSRSKTTVFDSKLGGVPYLPKSMEYPTAREGEFAGKPLCFLAQLNFGSLPKIPGFPTEGILQFFAGCLDDYSNGMDYDNGFNQNGFRIIYHDNVIMDETKLYSKNDMPDFSEENEYFPFKGEFLLTAEKAEPVGISVCDFRCDKAVTAAYNELFGGDVVGMWGRGKGIYDVDKELLDAICDVRNLTGTRIGGFPSFAQDDPRGYNEEYAKCTVMLFQSDSENGGEKDNWNDMICWGDLGVANFFISPEDLAKRDFSHVLYNWDCG